MCLLPLLGSASWQFLSLRLTDILKKLPPVIKALQEVAQNHGKTVSQVALNWVVCKGALPIPGAKNAKQAQDNAGGAGWHMTDDEVAKLDEITDKIKDYGAKK